VAKFGDDRPKDIRD